MLTDLRARLGDAVCSDGAVLQRQAVQRIAPSVVCMPRNANEVATVLRAALEHKIAVVPYGGGTHQSIGRAPTAPFIALVTTAMNTVIQHEPGDMVATVQPGITLAALQDALQKKNQWLPIDGFANATIGGMLAVNEHGPLAYGYGTLRDVVLGMTIVHGDGVIRKCGGRVVKNVTGYALDKLYIGSLGTLGVITEVTFKLRPLPPARRKWTIELNDGKSARATLHQVAAKNLPLETLTLQRDAKDSDRYYLMAYAIGTSAELNRVHAELNTCAPATSTEVATTSAGFDRRWEESRALNDAGAVIRFGCLRGRFADAWLALEPHARHISASINGGTAALNISQAQLPGLLERLRAAATNYRFEVCSGVAVAEPFGDARGEWSLMQRIRHTYDPAGILNPNRFAFLAGKE